MMRSMFAGVSGLRNHQIRLDVIGNNIANVNTTGFKASRVSFQEVFAQTIRGASSPQGGRGGTNPQQVGLGVAVASIDTIASQGNLQVTGKMTDLAVQGEGFFILSGGGSPYFTRDGAFELDSEGYLTNPSNGLRVQGWVSDADGIMPVKDQDHLSSVRIPVGDTLPARATGRVEFAHNLDARSEVGGTFITSIDVFDSLGVAHNIRVTFEKTDVNSWRWSASGPAGITGPGGTPPEGTISFNPDGSFGGQTGGPLTWSPPGAMDMNVEVDFSAVTQYAAENTVSVTGRDGYPTGTLENFTIDSTGTITGVYSNGLTRTISQVALAVFPNPAGLIKIGENLYVQSNNSGLRQVGEAATGGRGKISPGTLEMSNVDLSSEFTNLIVTQRGFQANSRVITASDEMLQELVNLKR